MKRITVLGNFSGRNAGDNAILGNLLRDLSGNYPDLQFLVPTLNAAYVRRAFSRYPVRALGLMPWNGALKIFGLPTAYSMLSADAVLITDNLLFDHRYFNPLFNYLCTISLLAPLCRRRGIPVVPYNASLGPIRTPRGRRAMQRVVDAMPAAILRDAGSCRLLEGFGPGGPEIILGADCALNTEPPPAPRIDEMLREIGVAGRGRPLLGFNVNSYIDAWQKKSDGFGRERFVKLVASAVDRLIRELDVDVVFFVTQVMDGRISGEVIDAVQQRDRVFRAENPTYDFEELAGILSRVELLVGMRTHSLILACSVETPIVNLNAYPKSKHFIDTVGMGGWSLEIDDLSEEALCDITRRAWAERERTRATLAAEVPREKAKSLASIEVVGRLLGIGVKS